MDVFIIKLSNSCNVDKAILLKYQQKEISDLRFLNQHCFAYYMLDYILKNFYNVFDRKLEFINKKPFLVNRAKFFSISHSDEYIVLCFSDNDCAIDIEKMKYRNFEKIAQRMNFACKTLENFYFEWTKFEAEYKLGKNYSSIKTCKYFDYIITILSDNIQEIFNVYIQSTAGFSKINI